MKITKIGHCCLLIEEKGLRVVTDPGTYTTAQNELTNIDLILISHEHADHFHVESVKAMLAKNPKAKIITNSAVGKLLAAQGIAFDVVEDGQQAAVGGVSFEAFGTKHAEIFREFGQVPNTGYLIGTRLFYPGDAFHNPGVPVDVLALPVAGPWCKIGEALEYALAVKPKVCFSVHDAVLKTPGGNDRWLEMILPKEGVEFVSMEIGKEREF